MAATFSTRSCHSEVGDAIPDGWIDSEIGAICIHVQYMMPTVPNRRVLKSYFPRHQLTLYTLIGFVSPGITAIGNTADRIHMRSRLPRKKLLWTSCDEMYPRPMEYLAVAQWRKADLLRDAGMAWKLMYLWDVLVHYWSFYEWRKIADVVESRNILVSICVIKIYVFIKSHGSI